LLLKADGTKFGKSESGALWLDADLTSPYEIYQYFLNASDADVENYLKTLTLLSRSEIEALLESSKQEPEKREAQKKLAAEIVILVHGKEALNEALKVSEALFSGDFGGLSKSGLAMLEKTLDVKKVLESYSLIDALVDTGLSSSKREARTFIQSGAIIVNETKISDLDFILSKENALFGTYQIIRRGKKKYAMVVYT
jgi:tyrosyl-tRNA synthetase